MRVVIILPTYNERENIVAILEGLRKSNSSVKHHKIFYLVVDDNSPDGTQAAVRKYQKSHKDVYLITGPKEGLGKALLRGAKYAIDKLDAQILGQIDADLSHDPTLFPLFLEALDNGADIAVGSRYIPGGSIPDNWAFYRKLYSVFGNAIVRFGLGFPFVHDWTGGYRAYKRAFFEKIQDELVSYSGYVFQIAFLHKLITRHAKVKEIPIHFTDRKFGRSKIAPSEYIRNVLLYVGKERFQRLATGPFGKFAIVGLVGFVINTIVLELVVHSGGHPALGSFLGAECAIVSNFFFNNRWTFGHKRIVGVRKFYKFLQFNGASFGAILLQAGTVAAGTHMFGISSYRIFYLIGVGFGLLWNYTMYSRVIWR